MRDPQAQPAYRVPRPNLDDLFVKDMPPDPPRPAVGVVTDVADTGRTVEVNDAGETITVVCLGAKPNEGDQIDYYLIDGLAYTPEPAVGGSVYVQPNEPSDAVKGTLWFDTDEPVP